MKFFIYVSSLKANLHKVEKARLELEETGFAVYETEIGGEGVKAWTNS